MKPLETDKTAFDLMMSGLRPLFAIQSSDYVSRKKAHYPSRPVRIAMHGPAKGFPFVNVPGAGTNNYRLFFGAIDHARHTYDTKNGMEVTLAESNGFIIPLIPAPAPDIHKDFNFIDAPFYDVYRDFYAEANKIYFTRGENKND